MYIIKPFRGAGIVMFIIQKLGTALAIKNKKYGGAQVFPMCGRLIIYAFFVLLRRNCRYAARTPKQRRMSNKRVLVTVLAAGAVKFLLSSVGVYC